MGPSSAVDYRVVSLYQDSGYSIRRIARELGLDRQRVSGILRIEGVEVAPKGAGRSRPLRVSSSLTKSQLHFLYIERQMSSVEIGRILGLSDRFIRSRLKLWGIDSRTRGSWNRFDRSEADTEDLVSLYVDKGWTATEVGLELGISRNIVLRSAHSNGIPVRAGAANIKDDATAIHLIDALYGDRQIMEVLRENNVPIVWQVGPIWRRFPKQVELTRVLLTELYLECGVSCFHIELLTGVAAPTVVRRLEEFGIARRGRGGRSPFIRRWHASQRRVDAWPGEVVEVDSIDSDPGGTSENC